MAIYRLFMPKQAVGLSLVYFDLFNATGSGSELTILSVLPVVSGAVAVTGVVGLDLLLTRTTAVGTGGTASTVNGTDTTAATISGLNNTQPIHSSITARLTPTGGATAGAVLGWRSVFTEETADASYTMAADFASGGQILVPLATGIRVVQGAVASVGNIGFEVTFRVRKL